MNKFQHLVGQLGELGLPETEYAIYGSGPLAVRGLRASEDLDILVTDSLYNLLVKQYGKDPKWNRVRVGEIEFYPFWNWEPDIKGLGKIIQRAETIDGLRYVRLDDLAKCKSKMTDLKHHKDVCLIRKFLKD